MCNPSTAADTARSWRDFDTVLLDMDGTILDLAFDNYFWRELVPRCFARSAGISEASARAHVYDHYARREGTLEWYCLDHWAAEFGIDLRSLKRASSQRVRYLPGAREFLAAARTHHCRVMLVTNAHADALAVKKGVAGLAVWIDEFVTSHEIGYAKEDEEFWPLLCEHHALEPASTLLIDDSFPVLAAAADFGIAGLIGISRPDSRKPARVIDGFRCIDNIGALLGTV